MSVCSDTSWLFEYLESFTSKVSILVLFLFYSSIPVLHTFSKLIKYSNFREAKKGVCVFRYVWLSGMWLFGGSIVFIQTTVEFIYLKISWDDADGVKSERYDDRRRGVVHGVDRKGLNFYSNKSQKLKSISYLKLLKNWIWRRLCSTNVSFFFQNLNIFSAFLW